MGSGLKELLANLAGFAFIALLMFGACMIWSDPWWGKLIGVVSWLVIFHLDEPPKIWRR